MRRLTIRRKKSFVACLSKVQVYIEDSVSPEIVISGVRCRKLGSLKNNEEATFDVSEAQAKIFVIADKLSKNYCNEFYQLPAGKEDIYLSGENKYNPANGNAFRFDNNETSEVLQNRKKGLVKGIIILCASFLVGSVIGYVAVSGLFAPKEVEPKVFSDHGMSITLTNQFSKLDVEGFTNCYDSSRIVVLVLEEKFSSLQNNYTLEEYGKAVLSRNNRSSTELEEISGLLGFEYEYTNPDTKDTYKYLAFVYKSNDAFWLVQFATMKENYSEYAPQMIKWAKTVSFE